MGEAHAAEEGALVIGVDGGGSKTLALLADTSGQVLGQGVGGPSNVQAVGPEIACGSVEVAIDRACSGKPVTPAALCLGMAGAGRTADRELWQRWAHRRYPGVPVRVVHDGQLALAAGTPNGWGIAVLCGTGSLVYGEDTRGRAGRAGGWGYLLGDEGSGYAIGLAALQAIARAADGRGPATALTQAILEQWSLEKPQDLIAYLYRPEVPRTEIAALAPVAVSIAAQGDATARALLCSAGEELARAARAVVAQLALPQPVPCALAGGVILHAPAIVENFRAAAASRGLSLSPITPVPEPAQGAVRLARRLLTQPSH